VDLAEVVAAALDGARRDWPAAVFEADLEPCVVAGHARVPEEALAVSAVR